MPRDVDPPEKGLSRNVVFAGVGSLASAVIAVTAVLNLVQPHPGPGTPTPSASLTGSVGPVPTPAPTPTPASAAAPAFLDNLTPTDGTTPQRGATTFNGASFHDGLTYPSSDSKVSTSWDVGASYTSFSAVVGVDRCQLSCSDSTTTFTVLADGRSVATVAVEVQQNVAVSAQLNHARVITLVMEFSKPFPGVVTWHWGDATVTP